MKLRLDRTQTIFTVFLILAVFVGLSCISAADVDGNQANASFINSTADFAGSIDADGSSSVNATVIEPCETDDGHSGAILDGDNDFTMSARYNAGTGYHWEISPETHGVEVISTDYQQDHPDQHICGGSGTVYYGFHVTDDDYYVKLVLISPSGNIVDEIDSNMIN